jgi:gamma-glutamylcyclotransferase (GGCT)/AIG2-like uncharacterized protein YtfP
VPAAPTRPYGYPAFLADGGGRVLVELYELRSIEDWRGLDALELYDPDDEDGSEFLRRSAPVIEGPVARAQIYVYDGPADVLGEIIPGGDWIAFDG